MDRSVNFHEMNESQMLSSGVSMFRRNSTSTGDLPPLSQCLVLDPITMGDGKFTRSGELRRLLGNSFGNTQEKNSFGAAYSKLSPSVATAELKRFRAIVQDASVKARGRSKKLDESLQKLNKYSDALNSKKKQRNEILSNERLSGSNLSKLGNQIHRNSPELVIQRQEDHRTKNIVLNKRVRTSATEIRAEGNSNNLVRNAVMGNERYTLRDGGECSDLIEEKIHILPGGGETRGRKMKRKRSMGSVFARHVDGDDELKWITDLKLNNESALLSSDAQETLRSGSLNGGSKLDVTCLPTSSNVFAASKSELGKVARDSTDGSNKERVVLKENSIRENNCVDGVYTLTKRNASREPRTGPVKAGNSSPMLPRSSGVTESWEQPLSRNNGDSANGANSRKRPFGSASPSMAQWVGQRPQKISRTRRANLATPVLNSDEVRISSEGCSLSDVGARMTSYGANGSQLLVKGAGNCTQEVRLKHGTVSFPTRLSEIKESGAGENGESRLKEKGSESNRVDERALNSSPSVCSSELPQKNKIINKGEIGLGMQRQGRSGRGSSLLKSNIPPMREKLETPTSMKLTRKTKSISENNGSKSGRPLIKKLSDQKSITRLGHTSTSSSMEFIGGLDNDREELLAAASFACNASYNGCSSSFWKKLEPIFAPVGLDDTAFMKQLLKSTEDNHESLSQMLGLGNDASSDLVHKKKFVSQDQRERILQDNLQDMAITKVGIVDQHRDADVSLGRGDSKRQTLTPLYQRVLSALIIEDQSEEEDTFGGAYMSLPNGKDESPRVTCFSEVVEDRSSVKTEFSTKSVSGLEAGNQCASDRFSCNGTSIFTSGTGILDEALYDDLLQVHRGSFDLGTEMFPMVSGNNHEQLQRNFSGTSSEQMCMEDKLLLELQSLGLLPENVPDLAEGEDEAINQDIIQVQKQLHQQVVKKKEHLKKLIQASEESMEMETRSVEQVAMNKLVELAYKKKLQATRGSTALRSGLLKVSRQVAMAFMKRTLARCQKFEDSGKSCFLEAALKDVLCSASTRGNDAECVNRADSTVAINLSSQAQFELESGSLGFFPSRVEQYDLYNDKAGSNSFDVPNHNHPCNQNFAITGPILNRSKKKELMLDDVGVCASLRAASSLLGGAKGKRSERERDKDTSRISSAKSDRPYMRGERKTKAKPKPKAAHQRSTTKNGLASKFTETTNSEHPSVSSSGEVMTDSSNIKSKVGSLSHGQYPNDSSKELEEPIDFKNLQLHELDSMELGEVNELGGHQDLGSWLNIDEDGVQDHDSVGLATPMDDLSDLNMFL
ncbi:Spectrin beta chain, brain [Quillaja saponaria]|uniref:Spectrin beta chain, brain n=1 Tax=Quillaja saponaria TaxID=32244 RepID=A0AAD7M5W7_QUISA|nr:Spectrin beta chain, brain [Quillaja saponaria]